MRNLINDYCDSALLTNEAAVESLFADKLIKSLGYLEAEIAFKESISEIVIGTGRKKVPYKPDYVLKIQKTPAVVIDAKSPTEDIHDWEKQGSSYCLELNKSYEYNPVQFYCLTNGLKTALYRWDRADPIAEFNFEDCHTGNPSFEKLCNLIRRETVLEVVRTAKKEKDNSLFEFTEVDLATLTKTFQNLHQEIWRKEQKSPSAAFSELIKIVFIKLNKDKAIHQQYGEHPKPKYADVIFSKHWIQGQTETEDPVNDLLFAQLLKDLEKQIKTGKKKRVFTENERINLSPETIERIITELEHVDLYAMEEDIHGRLFESFLDATVRGKDIGQFFTPRDIVNLMVDMVDFQVGKERNDTVLDACCGSGGFLICSMTAMLAKSRSLVGLSNIEHNIIEKRIREESIVGVDAGSDPAMYRIARMNMYLHGDGGSRIYHADSLVKQFGMIGQPTLEEEAQFSELQQMIEGGKKFDVILSNPPFSVVYSREDQRQKEILDTYELGTQTGKKVSSLLSSVMFLERYYDLVSDNGIVFAIIDESILSGEKYKEVRKFIRKKFKIVGIVSLPGDAFHRSNARVKTSFLILQKKKTNEQQMDVFMEAASYIGLENDSAKRIGIPVQNLQSLKQHEYRRILNNYKNFKDGIPGPYVVPFSSISDRMDVKYCIGLQGRLEQHWKDHGYTVRCLGDVLIPAKNRYETVKEDTVYQLLRVSYDGTISEGGLLDMDSSYSRLQKVESWDILISNMGVGRGATGVVPEYLSGNYVSSEYTILRAKTEEEALYYSMLLRTDEVLADILSYTTGMNRGRIKWETIKTIKVPEYQCDRFSFSENVQVLKALWEQFATTKKKSDEQASEIETIFRLGGQAAKERWLSYKPPE